VWKFTAGEASSLCFIAIAAYTTPMAPQIQILHTLRDRYLLTNPLGQAFVSLYYRLSPPVANFITGHASFKPLVRAWLAPIVEMSTLVIATTALEKMVVLGLLVLIPVAVGLRSIGRRYKQSGATRE
jgi:hypothetical protein